MQVGTYDNNIAFLIDIKLIGASELVDEDGWLRKLFESETQVISGIQNFSKPTEISLVNPMYNVCLDESNVGRMFGCVKSLGELQNQSELHGRPTRLAIKSRHFESNAIVLFLQLSNSPIATSFSRPL